MTKINESQYQAELKIQLQETIRAKDKLIDRLKQLGIVKPSNNEKLHQFSVFYQLLSNNPQNPHEYTFSRSQKRSSYKSIRKIKSDSCKRSRIYYKTFVPNAINVLNKIKEHINAANYEYVKSNTINCKLTPNEMIEIIEGVLQKN